MIDILYEDKDIIVVDKPVGVSSQVERGFGEDMISILMNYLYNKGEKNPYIGVVHRLDKSVGGVMVYAKNKVAAAKLSNSISSRNIEKRYYAAIYNSEILEPEGKLGDFLLKNGKMNISEVVSSSVKGSKEAELMYKIIKTKEIEGIEISLVDIKLITGRHHQIRVQFSSRGCPLVGDRKYNKLDDVINSIKNIGLYSYSLIFNHPITNEKMKFEMEPKEGAFILFF